MPNIEGLEEAKAASESINWLRLQHSKKPKCICYACSDVEFESYASVCKYPALVSQDPCPKCGSHRMQVVRFEPSEENSI